MPRAHRYFIPGYIWHITHRCHKKEFLLKFARDRQRYIHWLYQASKRFRVKILNYTVTSNHIHLLVRNAGDENDISAMMQLVAGRTGQEYNSRKGRKGAFWEDRYHATAIESGSHLRRCLTYIDLNMVRTGVAKHPEEWPHGGYHEIQGNRRRNRVIDLTALAAALEIGDAEVLASSHKKWVAEALNCDAQRRDDMWSQSVAVGSVEYVQKTRGALGLKGKARDVCENDGAFQLREAQESYGPVFGPEN